MNSLYSPKQI